MSPVTGWTKRLRHTNGNWPVKSVRQMGPSELVPKAVQNQKQKPRVLEGPNCQIVCKTSEEILPDKNQVLTPLVVVQAKNFRLLPNVMVLAAHPAPMTTAWKSQSSNIRRNRRRRDQRGQWLAACRPRLLFGMSARQ